MNKMHNQTEQKLMSPQLQAHKVCVTSTTESVCSTQVPWQNKQWHMPMMYAKVWLFSGSSANVSLTSAFCVHLLCSCQHHAIAYMIAPLNVDFHRWLLTWNLKIRLHHLSPLKILIHNSQILNVWTQTVWSADWHLGQSQSPHTMAERILRDVR
jgi:hypothetical protein